MSDYNRVASNEQWLAGGDCSKCRRGKYCNNISKPCKEHERFVTNGIMKSALRAAAHLYAECGLSEQFAEDSRLV